MTEAQAANEPPTRGPRNAKPAATFLDRINRSGIAGVPPGGLESPQPARLPDRAAISERVWAEVDYIASLTSASPDRDAVDALIAAGSDGLDRLNAQGGEADLYPAHLAGLEAVIRTDGTRPVLFVRGDAVDTTQPSLIGSGLEAEIGDIEGAIQRVCKATGRVNDPDPRATLGYQGTAFVVGAGLVMTNRHVLKEITRERNPDRGTLKEGITINFGHEIGATRLANVCRVTEIKFRGRAGQGEFLSSDIGLNFDELDIAVLAIEPGDRGMPEPLLLPRGDGGAAFAVKGRRTFLVGYPGNTAGLTSDIFDRVFGGVKSFKRFAPGVIVEPAGDPAIALDPDSWTLTHDASTLGGNSGSPICDRESGGSPLLGIHFAGMPDRRNWGHGFETLGAALAGVKGINFAS